MNRKEWNELEKELNSDAFIGCYNYDMDVIFGNNYKSALREIRVLIDQAKPTNQDAKELMSIFNEAWNPSDDDLLSPRAWLAKQK